MRLGRQRACFPDLLLPSWQSLHKAPSRQLAVALRFLCYVWLRAIGNSRKTMHLLWFQKRKKKIPQPIRSVNLGTFSLLSAGVCSSLSPSLSLPFSFSKPEIQTVRSAFSSSQEHKASNGSQFQGTIKKDAGQSKQLKSQDAQLSASQKEKK